MQFGGRGRLEAHPPGVVDGARFEGRFVIFAMSDRDGPVFGADVSLFETDVAATHGKGAASAHLVAVRSGAALEGFGTGEGEDFAGHVYGRTTSSTRLHTVDAAITCTRVMGARGSLADHPMPRLLAIAQLLTMVDGATGVQRLLIGRDLVRRAAS